LRGRATISNCTSDQQREVSDWLAADSVNRDNCTFDKFYLHIRFKQTRSGPKGAC
jgi:hypothetical protein